MVTLNVGYGGLQAAGGAGLSVSADSKMHGNNNGNATAGMANALQNMASYFADALAEDDVPAPLVPPVRITAISLPLGGLFDFQIEWLPPHVGHRFGNEADVGMAGLTDDQKDALATAIAQVHLQTPVWAESPSNPGANHWHVRLP